MSSESPSTPSRLNAQMVLLAPFRAIRFALRFLLGDNPGIIWMIVLWLTLGLMVWTWAVIGSNPYLTSLSAIFPNGQYWMLALPVAMLAAYLYQDARRSPPRSRWRIPMLIIFAAAMVGIYLLSQLLVQISPPGSSQLPLGYWLLFSLIGVVFFLIVSRISALLPGGRDPLTDAARLALGERPGAYSMILLWIALALAMWDWFLAQANYTSHNLVQNSAAVQPYMIALPLAMIAAYMHWSVTRPTRLNPARIGMFIVIVLSAISIYVLSLALYQADPVHGTGSWVSFSAIAVFGLFITRRFTRLFYYVGRVVHWALGERPGAYWMIPLWIMLIIVAWSNIAGSFFYYIYAGKPGVFDSQSAEIALAIAVVIVGLRAIVNQRGSGKMVPTAIRVVLGCAAILAAVTFIFNLTTFLQLPTGQGTEELAIMRTAPGVFTFWVVFTIVISQRWTLPRSWRLLTLAAMGGWLLTILLAYPIISWTYTNFVPGGLPGGTSTTPVPVLCVLLAIGIAIALGPLTVLWTRPSTRQQRLVFGGMVGGMAAFILYATLVAPTAGIIGGTPLYGVAQSRVGFNDAEWLIKLAQNVNSTIILSAAAFWIVLLVGALIGAITSLLMPVPSALASDEPTADTAKPTLLLTGLATLIPLATVTLSAFIILTSLGPAIGNIFSQFGYSPDVQPELTTLVIAYQSWLALTVVQVLCLYGLSRRQAKPYGRPLAMLACLDGVVIGLLGILLVAAVAGFTVGWINVVLGLEMLLTGVQLYKDSTAVEARRLGLASWGSAGLWALIISTFFLFPLVSSSLSLTLIPIPILVELAKVNAPAPGLPWLQAILAPLYTAHAGIFTSLWPTAVWLIPVSLAGVGWPFLIGFGVVRLLPRQTRSRLLSWLWQRISSVAQLFTTGNPSLALRMSWLRVIIALLAIAVFLLVSDPTLRAICVFISLLIIGGFSIERIPAPVVALAFILTAAGWFVLWFMPPVPFTALSIAIICMLPIATFIAYRALIAYTPVNVRAAVRVATLVGFVLVSATWTYLNQSSFTAQGGVSRYDGQRWEVFTPKNSSLGVEVGYRFYKDREGSLWFASNKGSVVEQSAGQWTPHMLGVSTGASFTGDTTWAQNNVWIAEAEPGSLWAATGTELKNYDPNAVSDPTATTVYPKRYLTSAEVALLSDKSQTLFNKWLCSYGDSQQWAIDPNAPTPTASDDGEPTQEPVEMIVDPAHPEQGASLRVYPCHLTIDQYQIAVDTPLSITGMASDSSGGTWVGTSTNGVIHLVSGKPDTDWQLYLADGGQLASNNINTLTVDGTGSVWVGTDHDVSWFDGKAWHHIDVPGLTAPGVTKLLVDNQGGIWAGTPEGLQHYDGKAWTTPIKDITVTAFAPGSNNSVWVGTTTGLIHYTPSSGAQDLFNAQNSGMATDSVYDLYMDSDGKLWVSTFHSESSSHSPFLGFVFTLLFFGGISGYTYRGYRQSPDTRAKTLGKDIATQPDSLYPQAYQLLANESGGRAILNRLPNYLSASGDPTGAASLSALADLGVGHDIASALNATVTAFGADSQRQWATMLSQLHGLLAAALAVQRVADVTALELTVNPGLGGNRIALAAKDHHIESLAAFMPAGSAEAWQALEKVGGALRKYQDVDNTGDQLSYLAEALSTVEAAQSAAQRVGAPEGPALVAIAIQWRQIVTHEITFISGSAELRIELRTRQALRSAEVQLALRVQNTGRAAAEDVLIHLKQNEGFRTAGNTDVRLDRLPSGQSAPIEFTITPAAVDTARVNCEVIWTDRAAQEHRIEFADVIRFYDVKEEFRRIPNPYIVGHPVKGAEMFYGREDIFRFIAENFTATTQDRTIVLHGQRRTGKTSILYQLMNGRLGEKFIPILIDMQELASMVESTADFFGEIAYEMGRDLDKAGVTLTVPDIEAFSPSPTRTFNRFLDALEDSLGERKVVLMFDEFELIQSKIADGKLDVSVLGYFRSLIQHRSYLGFIFTGTHRLQEMSHDYWSILFNIALHRQVSFLSEAEATALIRKPVAGLLDVDDLAIEKIFNLTSGHAYFIQLLCWALINECNAKERNYATINDVNDAVQEMLTTGEAHFAYIWQLASYEERLALAGLAHTIRPGKPWARPAEILETLSAAGDSQTDSAGLIKTLDQLVAQEVLEVAREGALRYRFQLEVLRLWVATNKSIAVLIERGS